MGSINTTLGTITLDGLTENWKAELSSDEIDGIIYVKIKLDSPQIDRPPAVKLSWTYPMIDVYSMWHPGAGTQRSVKPDWSGGYLSRSNSGAPVLSLLNSNDTNKMTIAFSDAMNPVKTKAGVHEENGEINCSVQLFAGPSAAISSYQATLRLDMRSIPYYTALRDASKWWTEQPGYTPSLVPDIARQPIYSTWYSFHQILVAEEVEKQCRLAKELGCEAVIVDDGWQMSDSSRGYGYCGDWEPVKIPDMASHVAKVHQAGLKYLLWYSVPFVGIHTKAWNRFKDKFLKSKSRTEIGILDPRFPDVREYLIGIYERAMREWDLDGFKLDFVDSFIMPEDDESGNGRDYDSVPEAVDRLLSDVISRLKSIKPDVMIEFRQSYIGPLMRKYGNMFRAGDCPNDALSNRLRTLDVRLISGNTATHSDMLMWHPDDTTESAALQIINVLFSVPQISVMLDKISAEHMEMLKFWLKFWKENRDVLLDGEIIPQHPDILYPSVISSTSKKRVAAVYSDAVLNPGIDIPDDLYIINGTLKDRVVFELSEDLMNCRMNIRDCRGRIIKDNICSLPTGLHSLAIPASGIAVIHRS